MIWSARATAGPDRGTRVSTEVLKNFRPWSGIVPAGYFAYCLGNLTRADYWDFPKEIRATYDRERFESFSTPSIDDNIFDWLIMFEAVVGATERFTMAALGAGWGRWLVAAAFAVKQYGNLPCRLIGVEAEPTHFRWMVEHFRDNGLNPEEHELIEAAAAAKGGAAWFYVGKPASWYGQSIIPDDALQESTTSQQAEYNGESVRRVPTIDLADLVSKYRLIDYLHMDIQGAELDFLSTAPKLLDSKVRRVLVGTHSHEVEHGLRRLFSGLDWRCQYDVPMNGTAMIDQTEVTLGDGVQVWINPGV